MAKISDEAYEELRLILEKKYQRAFTFEDVKEIGDGLVDFYSYLLKTVNKEEVFSTRSINTAK